MWGLIPEAQHLRENKRSITFFAYALLNYTFFIADV